MKYLEFFLLICDLVIFDLSFEYTYVAILGMQLS